jgi:hypothetical protein
MKSESISAAPPAERLDTRSLHRVRCGIIIAPCFKTATLFKNKAQGRRFGAPWALFLNALPFSEIVSNQSGIRHSSVKDLAAVLITRNFYILPK